MDMEEMLGQAEATTALLSLKTKSYGRFLGKNYRDTLKPCIYIYFLVGLLPQNEKNANMLVQYDSSSSDSSDSENVPPGVAEAELRRATLVELLEKRAAYRTADRTGAREHP